LPNRAHRDIHAPIVPRPSQPPKAALRRCRNRRRRARRLLAGPAWAAGKPIPAVTHLPNGIRPEGITVGRGPYACLESIADGSVHHADLRTGQVRTIAPGPGTAAAGLKLDGDVLLGNGDRLPLTGRTPRTT
jgi:hypothetical protein